MGTTSVCCRVEFSAVQAALGFGYTALQVSEWGHLPFSLLAKPSGPGTGVPSPRGRAQFPPGRGGSVHPLCIAAATDCRLSLQTQKRGRIFSGVS